MSDFANAIIEWGDPAQSITLLELLKGQLNIDPADTSRDAELSMYLEMAGSACEKYIDNIIDQRDVSERFKTDKHPIALRYYPVSDLVGVSVDGDDQLADYELFQEEGLSWGVKNTCGWHEGSCFEQMTLTYTAGYDPLPADLGYAVVAAGKVYEAPGGAAVGSVKKESVVGVGSIEYETGSDASGGGGSGMLTSSVTDVLDLYRRMWA